MIKLYPREMKNLSRILSIMLCFAPVAFASAGPVATTAGSNLTAYNPSTANNNQWATMSNGHYNGNTSAKADFGNCNALVLRCAQPKCSNGGCGDMSVASAIVTGCVQSNSSCKQYGDDLVQYMSAQLVASSNAKINEQNMAAQQAAAAAAAQQSQQQMQEMQYQMQQMQQQMAQQQAESQQQLQAALAQQAAQSQAALDEMKSAATASAMENEAGISAYQQDAINRGISTDVLERQKITGQIMTEIENAEASLKEIKVAMNTAFEYAKCDARGNNCEGPKRVKKWRELATEFLTPYDNTIDKIYDALELAQLVGVNLSDIYMMLNNSCNRWGQYMCPQMNGGQIKYNEKSAPEVCPKDAYAYVDKQKMADCIKKKTEDSIDNVANIDKIRSYCEIQNTSYKGANGDCRPCTLLKILSSEDEVYEGWVNPTVDDTSNGTVVACASGALDSSALFARRTKNKNGAGLVDIDKLDLWLHQNEPRKMSSKSGVHPWNYCDVNGNEQYLEKAMLSRVIPDKNPAFCVDGMKISDNDPKNLPRDEDCGYVNPIYAICDAHKYNIGNADLTTNTTETQSEAEARCRAVCADKDMGLCSGLTNDDDKNAKIVECAKTKLQKVDTSAMKEVVALKTTVISQQMYKQYEYINATLRRLKTLLEKATLTATLEAAGAKSEGSSSSGLLGSNDNDDKTIHLAGAENCANKMSSESLYSCVQTNVSLIISSATSNTKKACKQLQETISAANTWGIDVSTENSCKSINTSCNKTNIVPCAQKLNVKIAQEKEKKSQQQSFRGLMGYGG